MGNGQRRRGEVLWSEAMSDAIGQSLMALWRTSTSTPCRAGHWISGWWLQSSSSGRTKWNHQSIGETQWTKYVQRFVAMLTAVFVYLVANNELPVPSISTFQTGTVRRSSSDKPTSRRRQVSRHSKLDSLSVKPESQSIRKIVEVDHETTPTNADVRGNADHRPKGEDEIITDAADCSIMWISNTSVDCYSHRFSNFLTRVRWTVCWSL